MFYNCRSLSYLPDIYKWDINKVWNFSGIFACCISLIQLPDISKWKIGHHNNHIDVDIYIREIIKDSLYFDKKQNYKTNFT